MVNIVKAQRTSDPSQGGQNQTYVYTDGHPGWGLVMVETGASDGKTVEILSGLSAGDAYHYSYAYTVTYSFLSTI